MFEHHGRDSLTWYDDNQVLLPILNLGVPVAAVALCGLAILSWRGKERVWKVLALASVLTGITCGALARGSVVESRFPGYSLAGQVWWLKVPGYETRHNHSMQRMGASRSGQWQFVDQWRLAPIADADRSALRVCAPRF